MPVNYPGVAPWLHPPDIAGSYSKGFGLGLQSGEAQARIAMEQARLAQHANQQAVEITLKQQQLERNNMVEQQKLEVAKAYHQQQTELKAQDLQMKQQALQEKVKQAAARQMAFERFRTAIANKEDPARAALMNLTEPGVLSTAIRDLSERNSTDSEAQLKTAYTDQGEFPYLETRKGTVHPLRTEKAFTPDQEIRMANTVMGWDKSYFGGDTNKMNTLHQIAAARAEKALRGAGGGAETNAPSILPLPPKGKEDTAIDGALYYTPKGVLQYNKSEGRYLPPKPQASIETPASGMEVSDTDSIESLDDTESEYA